MAHGICLDRIDRAGLSDRIEVDSAGTAAYHAGEPPDPRTLATLRAHGLSLSHRARRVRPDDFTRFDWILAMDCANLRALRAAAPADTTAQIERVLQPVGGGDVADPYYGGPDGFEVNFAQLSRSIDAWIERWR